MRLRRAGRRHGPSRSSPAAAAARTGGAAADRSRRSGGRSPASRRGCRRPSPAPRPRRRGWRGPRAGRPRCWLPHPAPGSGWRPARPRRRAARARQQQQVDRAEQSGERGEQERGDGQFDDAPIRRRCWSCRGSKRRPRSSAPARRHACHTPPMPSRPCSKVSKRAGSRAMLSAARRSRVAARAAAIRSERASAFLGQENRGRDGLAERRQHLRRALVPERVFERERQEGRAGGELRQPAHALCDRHRPLPRIGEASRCVDPEQAVRRGQHLLGDAQEAAGARARPAPRRTPRAAA